MKIAVPVLDESLKLAGNAGHTPYFAIFNLSGGMFKSFTLEGLRPQSQGSRRRGSSRPRRPAHLRP
jgi:predicted Fe-Mo cluster-binding NifX family protein